jgi:hypothetical protein
MASQDRSELIYAPARSFIELDQTSFSDPQFDRSNALPPDSYLYTPLDTTRQRIRLVKVALPSSVWAYRLRPPYFTPQVEIDKLHCSMETFKLDTRPEYIALSYTWGDDSDLRHLYINEKPFRVRRNLYDFVKVFYSDGKNARSPWLWIDQLCIDQSSIDERNN